MLGYFQNFLQHFDLSALLDIIQQVLAVLLCLTVHETCHGLAALALGDPTAKRMHRLSFNPLHHIDWLGLLSMFLCGFGWAKAVPVDMRYFKNPKAGMALTALAGPAANFLTALAATAIASLIYHIAPLYPVWVAVLCLLSNLALLGVGMGLFNLIPISPLDGSKILFALLPDRAYYTILRYEKYVMGVLIVLVLLGAFDRPLSFLMLHVLQGFCAVTGMPMGALLVFQDAASIFQLF